MDPLSTRETKASCSGASPNRSLHVGHASTRDNIRTMARESSRTRPRKSTKGKEKENETVMQEKGSSSLHKETIVEGEGGGNSLVEPLSTRTFDPLGDDGLELSAFRQLEEDSCFRRRSVPRWCSLEESRREVQNAQSSGSELTTVAVQK